MREEPNHLIRNNIKILFWLGIASAMVDLIYRVAGNYIEDVIFYVTIRIMMYILLFCGYLGIYISKTLKAKGAVLLGLSICALVTKILILFIALNITVQFMKYLAIFTVLGELPPLFFLGIMWARGTSFKIMLILEISYTCLVILSQVYMYLHASGAITLAAYLSIVTSINLLLAGTFFPLGVLWVLYWCFLIWRPERVLPM